MTTVNPTIHQVSLISFSVCFDDWLLNTSIVSRSPFNARLVSSSDASGTTRKSKLLTQFFNSASVASSKFFSKLRIFKNVWAILDSNQ